MLYALQQASTNLIGTPGWKGKREQVEYAQPLRAIEAPDVAEQYDLPQGVALELPPEAALEAAEQPAGSTEEPKEHRRLERVPVPEASSGNLRDQYFVIPKDPGVEVTMDEMWYQLSRMTSFGDSSRKPDAQARAAGLSFDADGFVQQAEASGGPQLPSSGNCGVALSEEAA